MEVFGKLLFVQYFTRVELFPHQLYIGEWDFCYRIVVEHSEFSKSKSFSNTD